MDGAYSSVNWPTVLNSDGSDTVTCTGVLELAAISFWITTMAMEPSPRTTPQVFIIGLLVVVTRFKMDAPDEDIALPNSNIA